MRDVFSKSLTQMPQQTPLLGQEFEKLVLDLALPDHIKVIAPRLEKLLNFPVSELQFFI